jgi:hypothetical protein
MSAQKDRPNIYVSILKNIFKTIKKKTGAKYVLCGEGGPSCSRLA